MSEALGVAASLPLAAAIGGALPRSFYERSVLVVARELIGKTLVHCGPDGVAAGRIVETEAYRGPEDLAAHSAAGRRTKRNEAMWGSAGRVYMFLLYGVHWAFNVVTGTVGQPHAVLIRALEPCSSSLSLMCRRRAMGPQKRELTNGPGKLCAALGLDGSRYGHDLCENAKSNAADALYIAPPQDAEETSVTVGRSPRINIDYSGVWAAKPWRFYERGNRYVSVKPRD